MKSMIKPKYLISLFVVLLGCSSDGGNDSIEEPIENPVEINEAPSTPLLVFPSNELICIENELKFEWNEAIDNDGDPITYFVEVANDVDFSDMAQEISTLELSTVMLLEKGQTLFWRVRASDNKTNYSNYSDIWKFYTEAEPEPNRLPSQPELLNPAINTMVSGSNIDLTWNTTDEDGDPLIYDLYFGTDENPPMHLEGYEKTVYSISIEAGNSYYWKIVSKDNKGGVSIGPIWNFFTE